MAKASFTLKKPGLLSLGSFLQKEPGEPDDSPLRGDGYVSVPATVSPRSSQFEAKPYDYGIIKLKWGIGEPLYSTFGADPVPTQIMIRYDTKGEPQTVSEGSLVTTITPDRSVDTFFHGGLPDGTWVYYSLFVKYESTQTRAWYERVTSVHALLPYRYGSTEMLWDRIPRHYRITDGADSGPIPLSSPLYGMGPLYRLLDIVGWDMDRLRTLIHHQTVTKDPELATTEALDALAVELGIDLTTKDLGTQRLRSIISDIGYFRQKKGTVEGVRELLTAISGSDVEVRPVVSNLLTSTQSTFDGTITNTTNHSLLPTGNTWVVVSTNAVATADTDGVLITKSSGSDYELVVAKTAITNVNQGSMYSLLYDVTNRTGASVAGVAFTTTNQTAASVTMNPTTGGTSWGVPGFKTVFNYGTSDWFQAPLNLGMPGDGTYTTTTMYLHIFMKFGPATSSLKLNNVSVKSQDAYPYEIDLFTQRVNLCRDPKFFYGAGAAAYWSGSALGGASVTVYSSSPYLSASSGTGASVMFSTNSSAGAVPTPIPVRLGIPYYFSITDRSDSFTKVELKSLTYGTLATSTDTFSEVQYIDGSIRKTWRLIRNYEDPWLPLNIDDCYLEMTGYINGSTVASVTQPILESLHAGNDYFDGDNINGGWLSGDTPSSGVSDYRWGDAGQHISFSYYTSDYRRVVQVLYRLLDAVLPVTESGNPVDIINLDRIYGYSGLDRP